MITISNESARTLFVGLLMAQRELSPDIISYAREVGEAQAWFDLPYSENRGMVFDIVNNSSTTDMSVALDEVRAALGEPADEFEETLPPENGTLMEILAKYLKKPWAGNIIGGEVLERLRRAILDPIETAELANATINAMYCSNCGVAMEYREVASFTAKQDENGNMIDPQVICSRCGPPLRIKCSTPGCNHTQRFHRSEVYCEEHRREPAAEVTAGSTISMTGEDSPFRFLPQLNADGTIRRR